MERVWKGIGIGDEGRRGERQKKIVFVGMKGCDCGGKGQDLGQKVVKGEAKKVQCEVRKVRLWGRKQ